MWGRSERRLCFTFETRTHPGLTRGLEIDLLPRMRGRNGTRTGETTTGVVGGVWTRGGGVFLDGRPAPLRFFLGLPLWGLRRRRTRVGGPKGVVLSSTVWTTAAVTGAEAVAAASKQPAASNQAAANNQASKQPSK